MSVGFIFTRPPTYTGGGSFTPVYSGLCRGFSGVGWKCRG